MAKVKRIPLGLEPGQQRIELPDRVSVELASLAGTVREGLLAFAVGVGMQVFRTMLEEDVAAVAGPKGRHDPAGRLATATGTRSRAWCWAAARSPCPGPGSGGSPAGRCPFRSGPPSPARSCWP